MRRAAAGNAEAFGHLYDAYADRVYAYCLSRVSDRHDAEDLTEAVFLRAYEAIGGYDERGLPFGAWLFRIARNTVIDSVRRKARRPEEAAEPGESEDPGPGPEEAAIAGFEAERVRECISLLTDDQAAVLTLRYLWGFDIRSSARALCKTEGAVKALQHRALRSLQRLLAEDGLSAYGEETADAV